MYAWKCLFSTVVVVHAFVYEDNVKTALILKNVKLNVEEPKTSQSNLVKCTHHFAQWTRALFGMCAELVNEWVSACVSIYLPSLSFLILFRRKVHSDTCVEQIIVISGKCSTVRNVYTQMYLYHCILLILFVIIATKWWFLFGFHIPTRTHKTYRV